VKDLVPKEPTRPYYYSKNNILLATGFYFTLNEDGTTGICGIHNEENLAQRYGMVEQYTLAQILSKELSGEFSFLQFIPLPGNKIYRQ